MKAEELRQATTPTEEPARIAGGTAVGAESDVTTRLRTKAERKQEGGPLSPLLSNVLLTELDRELERRGHAFCRHADDCNIYVRSMQAGERVMASITGFLADTLKLRVNAAKSAVAHPWTRKFLGFSLTWHKAPRLRIAPASLNRLEDKIRKILEAREGAA